MADLTYTGTGTFRRANTTTLGKGDAGSVKNFTSVIEIAAGATVGQTWKIGRIPSNARLTGSCELYWDDVSTASPDFDIGLASVNGNITSDPDAVNDGLDAGTASAGVKMIKTIDNIGKQAWEYVNGQTTDPGGELDLYVSNTVATIDDGGTLVADVYYTLD